MVLSLFASWLTARVKLENWLYWIVVDAVLAWLYAAQGLVLTAFLFLVYLVIAAAGFIEWWKTYRRQTAGGSLDRSCGAFRVAPGVRRL
jgi:nicotinamide mononucleotide transporter